MVSSSKTSEKSDRKKTDEHNIAIGRVTKRLRQAPKQISF